MVSKAQAYNMLLYWKTTEYIGIRNFANLASIDIRPLPLFVYRSRTFSSSCMTVH